MKFRNIIWGGLFLLSIQAIGQGSSEKKVAEAVESLRKGMVDPDKALLEGLVSDKLSYGHSSGALDDKAIFVDKLVSGKSDFVEIKLEDQTISLSGKVALVRHTLHAKTNDGGKPGEVHLKILLVWQKQRGNWELLARQAVRIQP